MSKVEQHVEGCTVARAPLVLRGPIRDSSTVMPLHLTIFWDKPARDLLFQSLK